MKAVILNGPNNFDVTELPKPEIGGRRYFAGDEKSSNLWN